MRKINKIQSILALFLVLILTLVLGACSSSNEVVSNNIITKRKHNKGFHFDLKKNYASEKGSDLAKVEKIAKEKNVVTNEELVTNYQVEQTSASLNDEFTETENVVEEKNEVNYVSAHPSSLISIEKSSKVEQLSLSKKEQKVYAKHVFKASKKFAKREVRDDTDEILIIVLCFLLPPLAVYLSEGSWTSKCTLNLILTLLCGLPGIIHALIVCLK